MSFVFWGAAPHDTLQPELTLTCQKGAKLFNILRPIDTPGLLLLK